MTAAWRGQHEDDSESSDGAIDDVLLAPERCRWRGVIKHMPA